MAGLMFTKTHEWVKFSGENTAKIGLSDYAQKQLGDLVFINLPDIGDTITVEEAFCDVESVKAVSDVYSPVTAVICAINEDLMDSPQLINEQPYDAWIIEVEDISVTADFMTEVEYMEFIENGAED